MAAEVERDRANRSELVRDARRRCRCAHDVDAQRVRDLERQLLALTASSNEQRSELSAQSAKLRDANEANGAMAQKLAEATQFVRQQSAHIVALSRALDDQSQTLAMAAQRAGAERELDERVELLHADLLGVQTHADQLERALDDAEAERDRLQATLVAVERDARRARATADATETALARAMSLAESGAAAVRAAVRCLSLLTFERVAGTRVGGRGASRRDNVASSAGQN